MAHPFLKVVLLLCAGLLFCIPCLLLLGQLSVDAYSTYALQLAPPMHSTHQRESDSPPRLVTAHQRVVPIPTSHPHPILPSPPPPPPSPPPPPAPLSVQQRIASVFGIYTAQAEQVAACESSFNPAAYNPVPVGASHAEGVFQILVPDTWNTTSEAAANPYNAASNIAAAWELFRRDGFSWREWACAPRVATSATVNAYPSGQCTWWANERYHALTGFYVPWSGDSWTWLSGAQKNGWHTSSTPPAGMPSIIVLQPGIQGANAALGHVGVVESVNSDGSVTTSDLNWGATPQEVAHVIFQVGQGVSFVWA